MKKITALLILVLCLVLAACGQENTQTPAGNGAAASGDAQVSSGETEAPEEMPEDFVEPTTVVEKTTPDGGQITFYLDALGRPMESIQDFSGYHHEFTYYPSGGTKIWITSDPSGYYSENHYMDNSYVKDGIQYDGTVTYSKTIAPDGIVTERTYEFGENGNRIEKYTSSDGTYTETHYENEIMTFLSAQYDDGSCYEEHYEGGVLTCSFSRGADGSYYEDYYENGELVKRVIGYSGEVENSYSSEIYYESGKRVYEITNNPDGTFTECYFENDVEIKIVQGQFNEAGIRVRENVDDIKKGIYMQYERNDAGIVTFYYRSNFSIDKYYYFDDSGVLIKYIEGATVIEDAAKLAEIAAKLDLENN